MLHQPYLQTPAKVLESGLIDDLFMKRKSSELQNKIMHHANGVFEVELTDNLHLFVCFSGEYNPIDDGYLYNINSNNNKQWLSLIIGTAQVQHFIEVVDSELYYIKESSINVNVIPTHLYRTGKDELGMNGSVLIEENNIAAVNFDPELDLVLLRYVHTLNPLNSTLYYEEKRYPFIEYRNETSFITPFKKQLRTVFNNAEAISRNISRLRNPYE